MAERLLTLTPASKSKYVNNGQKLLNLTLGKAFESGAEQRRNRAVDRSLNDGVNNSKSLGRKPVPALMPQTTYGSITKKEQQSRIYAKSRHKISRRFSKQPLCSRHEQRTKNSH